MHPHRVFTRGREVAGGRSSALGAATFNASPWRGANEGWNYALNAAALLGLTSATVPMLVSRAASGPARGYRFPGFAPHYQDYEPSADHFANYNRALQEMLVQSGEDGHLNATVVLLPAWPCRPPRVG
jgi:hypothetical protein